MRQLIDQAGLPDPRFPHQGDDLPIAGPCPRQGVDQRGELRVTANKAGQTPDCCCLQAPPEPTRTHQLEDLHRRIKPFDGHRAQRGDLDPAPRPGPGPPGVIRIEPGMAICSMRAAK